MKALVPIMPIRLVQAPLVPQSFMRPCRAKSIS